jgi:hypothetical protein
LDPFKGISLVKTKQGILANALLLRESVKFRLRLLREIIPRTRDRPIVGDRHQGRLQHANSWLLDTAISHSDIANLQMQIDRPRPP